MKRIAIITVRKSKPPKVVVTEPLPPCPYLGQPREETLTVELLCGCKSNRQRSTKTFIVHDCCLLGRCLPAYTCSPDAVETFIAGEWAEPCKGCERRG